MLEQLRRLLRTENDTSASLRAALAEIDLDALRAAQHQIGKEREELLFTGTTEQILEAESRLNVARIDVERAAVAHDALTARLSIAVSKESDEAVRTAVLEAIKVRDDYLAKLGRELPKIAKTVEALVAEGIKAARMASEANKPFWDDLTLADRLDVSGLTGPNHNFAKEGKLSELPDWLVGHFRRSMGSW